MSNIILKDRTKEAEEIAKLICECIQGLNVAYYVDYNGKAICIKSKDFNNEDVFIWCRLYWKDDICVFDISTVSIAPVFQRKGYFTKIINKLKECKYISNIRICSICTNEMKNWCVKHKFKAINFGNDYVLRDI